MFIQQTILDRAAIGFSNFLKQTLHNYILLQINWGHPEIYVGHSNDEYCSEASVP